MWNESDNCCTDKLPELFASSVHCVYILWFTQPTVNWSPVKIYVIVTHSFLCLCNAVKLSCLFFSFLEWNFTWKFFPLLGHGAYSVPLQKADIL